MLEREKQVSDQEKKHAGEKERQEHPKRDVKAQDKPGQVQAGDDTKPETMKDKGYVERITEKTEKH
jgi:hypothetical protein